MAFSEVHGQRWMLIVIHQVRYQPNTSQNQNLRFPREAPEHAGISWFFIIARVCSRPLQFFNGPHTRFV
jgi:hypothetical protein